MKRSAKFINILSRAFRATFKKSLVLASWRKDASENVPTEIWFSAPNTLHSCYSGAC